jgi:phospholipase/carboxylesterase
LHYERNYAYPLIVWLHGPGDDERQVTRVMPLVSMRNYVGVGVRGTVERRDGEECDWLQQPEHIELAAERVMAAIGATRRWLNIAPSRIYLAGYATGGTMALRLALSGPKRFAGVLSLGGAFPTTLRPLAQLQAARQLKIFMSASRASRLYPEPLVCEHLRLFHAAALSVDLRQYPGCDELTTNMFSDMDRWIMGQIADAVPVVEDEPSRRSG